MAAGTIKELCNICLERYDDDLHQPVALQCGHSFCRPCIQNQHQTHSSVICKNCRCVHEGLHPDALPTNFLLLNILQSVPSQREDDKSDKEEFKEKIKETCCDESDTSDSESDSDEEECKKEKTREKEDEKNDSSVPERETNDDGDESKLVSDINVEPIVKPKRFLLLTNKKKKALTWGFITLISVVFGLLTCYFIAAVILKSWGFTETGPARDSYATQMMSKVAKANNGSVPADSWYSWYQRAGQKGFDPSTTLLLWFAGFFICFSVLGVAACCFYNYIKCRSNYRMYKDAYNKYQESHDLTENKSV